MGKGARVRMDEGWEKRNLPYPSLTFHDPHPRSETVLMSRKAKVVFGMMDSATSPFGSAQNDKLRGIARRLKIFEPNKPIKMDRESGAVFIGY